jgi:hypothetical protein
MCGFISCIYSHNSLVWYLLQATNQSIIFFRSRIVYVFSKENFAGKSNGCFLTFIDDIPSKPVGVD